MSGPSVTPVHEPAHYVPDELTVFGAPDAGVWGGPDDPDPVARAARIQDQVARFVHRYLRATKITQVTFAEQIGIPRAKLNRLLRGNEWARLHELERLLGGCGETMTSVSWAIGDGRRQPERVRQVIAAYLHEQVALLGEETARTAPERSPN